MISRSQRRALSSRLQKDIEDALGDYDPRFTTRVARSIVRSVEIRISLAEQNLLLQNVAPYTCSGNTLDGG